MFFGIKEPVLRDQEINILLRNYPTRLSKVVLDSDLKFEDFQKTLINWKDIDKVSKLFSLSFSVY